MDLSSYLEKSKQKRAELIRAADSYFHKTQTFNNFLPTTIPNDSEIYTGPSPQRLRLFETEVSHQLRKFFTPGLKDPHPHPRYLSQHTTDDEIRKTYSRHSPQLKRRQLVILPKNNFITYLKVPEKITKLSVLPELNDAKDPKPTPRHTKRSTNQPTWLPVLSTFCSHDQRAKIYKTK